MKSDLFRANALEQLSSPEPMDEPPAITGFRYWIALAALFFLLGGAGIWAFQSTIVNTITGHGVFTISDHAVEVVAYVPSARAAHLVNGMDARILPTSMRLDQYGFIRGSIIEVTPGLGPDTSLTKIRVALQSDATTPSGLKWSASRGPSFMLTPGTACTAEIVVSRQRPISLLLPYLKKNAEGQ